MFYYVDKFGKRVINSAYVWAQAFRGGVACVKDTNEKVCFIDHSGEVVVRLPDYQNEPTSFLNGSFLIQKGSLFGYADIRGNEIIPPQFRDASPFAEGVAPVQKDKNYFFIDQKGKAAGRASWKELDCLSDGLAVAQDGSKHFYVDGLMDVVLGPFESAGPFREGVLCVVRHGQQQFLDRRGNVLFENRWDYISEISVGGRVCFSSRGKMGYVDTAGNEVVPAIYVKAAFYSEGIAIVEEEKTKKAINLKGTVLFQSDFDWIGEFKNGLARFRSRNKYGFINTKGQVVISNVFEWADDFSEGVAVVSDGKI